MSARRRLQAVLSLVLLSAPLAAHADIRYSVTPIGPAGSMPTGINSSGQVVGSFTAGDATHAFLYSGARFVDLGTLGGSYSIARGINDAGVVVGASDNAAGNTHAFVYANGTMTDLGTLGGNNSSAAAINSSGQVVGVADGADGSYAFLYSPGGGMHSLGTLPGGVFSRAESINDAGVVVGGSLAGTTPLPLFHAFMYASGAMTDLGSLTGAFSVAQAVNDRGVVVGWSNAGLNIDHAFLYAAGVMTDLGTLSGQGSSGAYDINNAGQVVGWSEVANKETRGILYENGAMVDLDALVDAASGWTIQTAFAINDLQQIAAYGCNRDACQALLLDPVSPVPEPRTDAMVLAGLALLGWSLRGRGRSGSPA
ncbi:probable extracellular repeat, HAF family [Massilia sp. PDC64]|nr:probable extracellular repeat, HAF family [Massilia sp. PDC64]